MCNYATAREIVQGKQPNLETNETTEWKPHPDDWESQEFGKPDVEALQTPRGIQGQPYRPDSDVGIMIIGADAEEVSRTRTMDQQWLLSFRPGWG